MFELPITDRLIHVELKQPQAKVLRYSCDTNSNFTATYDENPMLNSIVYNIEFPNCESRECSASIIAENMYSQVDANSHSHSLLESITDYEKNPSSINYDDMYMIAKSVQRIIRKSAKGWKLSVLWKDGTTQWIPQKLLKEPHPVEVAEFEVAHGLNKEPAFYWWVPFTLRKRDIIIPVVSKHVTRVSHKFVANEGTL